MATASLTEPIVELKKSRTWLKVLGIVIATLALCSLVWFFALWQHIGPTPGQCGGAGTPCAATSTSTVPTSTPVAPPTPPTPPPPPVVACSACETAALSGVPTSEQVAAVLAEARSACIDAGCK